MQSEGQRAVTGHFVLLVAVGPEGPSRLGLVVTKKVGNAVRRPRVKRVCRECFRLWPDFVPDGIDLVVIAREGAHELVLAQVREEWLKARPQLLKRCKSVLEAGARAAAASSSAAPPKSGPS